MYEAAEHLVRDLATGSLVDPTSRYNLAVVAPLICKDASKLEKTGDATRNKQLIW